VRGRHNEPAVIQTISNHYVVNQIFHMRGVWTNNGNNVDAIGETSLDEGVELGGIG
jgi:hypothetical protein